MQRTSQDVKTAQKCITHLSGSRSSCLSQQFHRDCSALYILRNVPVEVLESAGQIFVFRAKMGCSMGIDKATAMSVEGEMIGDCDRQGDNASRDGTMSCGTINSMQVKGMWLTGEGRCHSVC